MLETETVLVPVLVPATTVDVGRKGLIVEVVRRATVKEDNAVPLLTPRHMLTESIRTSVTPALNSIATYDEDPKICRVCIGVAAQVWSTVRRSWAPYAPGTVSREKRRR